VRGKKVIITFDGSAPLDAGPSLCYVYLRNKTFITAHLIERGYAEVDDEREFRHRAPEVFS
jgi:hypothetical protein